ncbi:MAG: phage tail sheath family protein [Actinobacteria bacterium]|nr:phage tail sheath family protein [Actinomycetota bacterium]
MPDPFPAVHVDEQPSERRAVERLPTSIAAFVGRALRGPLDDPVALSSFADFERVFGGLWSGSHLGYSVRGFFAQGGRSALVVRVHARLPHDTGRLAVGTRASRLRLAARSPGTWGSRLTAIVDDDVDDPTDAAAFTLSVIDTGAGVREVFRSVSYAADSARRVDTVVNGESTLVRVLTPLPTAPQTAFPAESVTWAGTNDGADIGAVNLTARRGMAARRKGLYALDRADVVNLVVVPPYRGAGPIGARDVDAHVIAATLDYATSRRAFVILDPPSTWTSASQARAELTAAFPPDPNGALYFPRIVEDDPLHPGQGATLAPSGAVAGIFARTDANHGVWKAPAGLDATLTGVSELAVSLSADHAGMLNAEGLNSLREVRPDQPVVWGARTLAGADRLGSEWRYVPVRRLALLIESSLERSLAWAAFEPNDETTRATLRGVIDDFLHSLWSDGAFQGTTSAEAFFVRCDASTTTPTDVAGGIITAIVGFAPLKPAEFVVLTLRLHAGPA